MNFIDDCDNLNKNYCIIEEHDMEVFEGVEGLEGLDELDKLDNIVLVDTIDTVDDTGVSVFDSLDSLDELREVELLDTLDLVGCDEHEHEEYETQQKREINLNSVGEIKNEKPLTEGIRVEFREVEMTINTSTVEEVIFKKHRVEIVDKCSRGCIMEGVVSGYQLVGRVYDPDIVLEFEDGRTFYNENFGYLMRFYI